MIHTKFGELIVLKNFCLVGWLPSVTFDPQSRFVAACSSEPFSAHERRFVIAGVTFLASYSVIIAVYNMLLVSRKSTVREPRWKYGGQFSRYAGRCNLAGGL